MKKGGYGGPLLRGYNEIVAGQGSPFGKAPATAGERAKDEPSPSAFGCHLPQKGRLFVVTRWRCIRRGGYFFSNLDTYLNIIGGWRLDEPAADLPVALALISGLKDKPIPEGVVAFGEVGLAGEVRSVSAAEQRVAEAARLGFAKILVPKQNLASLSGNHAIEVVGVSTVREAYEQIFS